MFNQETLSYIKMPYPGSEDLQLKIAVPMCKLVVSPGIGNAWVTGRYSDPHAIMQLHIIQNENPAKITAVGAFAYRAPRKWLPDMRLSFGRSQPFSLSITASDLENKMDFGGIPLENLEIQYSGGNQLLDFSYPTPRALKRLKIATDTDLVKIDHLSNANAEDIHLNGNAYVVNFGLDLKKSANMRFGPQVARAELIVPENTALQIRSTLTPASKRKDDFSSSDNNHLNLAAREHAEPMLNIHYAGSNGPLKVTYISTEKSASIGPK